MELERYEQYAGWLRGRQMKLAKAEEVAKKQSELVEAAITIAAFTLAPFFLLEELVVVEKLLLLSQVLNHVLRVRRGDYAAWDDVAEDVVGEDGGCIETTDRGRVRRGQAMLRARSNACDPSGRSTQTASPSR